MKRYTDRLMFRAMALLLLITGAGCNKFLDETDPTNLSPDTYYTLPEHADAAIFALDHHFQYFIQQEQSTGTGYAGRYLRCGWT